MLQDDQHDRGQRDHPQQRVAKLRARGHVGGPVARIDKADGDEQPGADVPGDVQAAMASGAVRAKVLFEMVEHGALLCMGGATSHLGRAAPRVGFGLGLLVCFALIGHGVDLGGDGRRVTDVALVEDVEIGVEGVDERHAGGDVGLEDFLGREMLELYDERAQGVAVRGRLLLPLRVLCR